MNEARSRVAQRQKADPAARPVIVVTAEDDRFQSARLRAQELAADGGAVLLLYDWDAPSLFAEPLPTWWSSEGSADRFGDRLDAAQLDEVGRSPIADQVRDAERVGLVACGWLPKDHGPEALARYARAQDAKTVVIPSELVESDGLEALLDGAGRPADAVAAGTSAEVITV
jgi:hypothetical protein